MQSQELSLEGSVGRKHTLAAHRFPMRMLCAAFCLLNSYGALAFLRPLCGLTSLRAPVRLLYFGLSGGIHCRRDRSRPGYWAFSTATLSVGKPNRRTMSSHP